MRTTLDIPDALFRRAKLLAVQRGTTLKALITSGLEKEIGIDSSHEAKPARLRGPLFELAPDSPLRQNPLIGDAHLDEAEAAHLHEVYRRR